MPAPIAPLLFAGPIVYIPFYLKVLTVIRGFFSLFFFFFFSFFFFLVCKRRVLCRLGVLCTSLLSHPSFSISVVHPLVSFFFGLAFAGCLGLGLLLAHYSLGLCLSSSAICCYHVSTSNCSFLHYYNPWDSLCQAYACNPPPCRLLTASVLLFSVSDVLRFSVIQTLVREIDQTLSVRGYVGTSNVGTILLPRYFFHDPSSTILLLRSFYDPSAILLLGVRDFNLDQLNEIVVHRRKWPHRFVSYRVQM